MLKSMTGYGKTTLNVAGCVFKIELKSLNSKQFDFICKLPSSWRECETDLKTILQNFLFRGKIELSVSTESKERQNADILNFEVLENYYRKFAVFSQEKNIPLGDNPLSYLIKLPDVFSQEPMLFSADDTSLFKQAVWDCAQKLDESRTEEGLVLEKDFLLRIKNIESYLVAIETMDGSRAEKYKNKMKANLLLHFDSKQIDENRFEQEVFYYLEKLDITEEKVRLKKHNEYFILAMKEECSGKKLSFIAQEIGREINTIGSKANDAQMQQMVVNMKDELEKIKEQLGNIL